MLSKDVSKLKILFAKRYNADTVYSSLPAPWLIVKLLRIINVHPVLNSDLTRILDTLLKVPDVTASKNNVNMTHAILFEALSLALQTDYLSNQTSILVNSKSSILNFLLSTREPNIKFLALQTCYKSLGFMSDTKLLKPFHEIFLASLNDKDNSAQKIAISLIYHTVQVDNFNKVITELLSYLDNCDASMKEEVILKIFALITKFSSDSEEKLELYYGLVKKGEDFVQNEVWFNFCHFIVANAELFEKASLNLLKELSNSSCSETFVKIASYVLGEVGHVIADSPGCEPINQLKLLYSKLSTSSQDITRYMLVDCLAKFYNMYPEIRSDIKGIFNRIQDSLNVELQQRAKEYSKLFENEKMLEKVFEEMPLYEAKQNPNEPRKSAEVKAEKSITMTPFKTMLIKNAGVIFENEQLQVGFKLGASLTLYVGNKSTKNTLELSIKIHDPNNALLITPPFYSNEKISPMQQNPLEFKLTMNEPFCDFPSVLLKIGSDANILNCQLPLSICKFLQPTSKQQANMPFESTLTMPFRMSKSSFTDLMKSLNWSTAEDGSFAACWNDSVALVKMHYHSNVK